MDSKFRNSSCSRKQTHQDFQKDILHLIWTPGRLPKLAWKKRCTLKSWRCTLNEFCQFCLIFQIFPSFLGRSLSPHFLVNLNMVNDELDVIWLKITSQGRYIKFQVVLRCNELVSLVLEASCSTAYIPILSLDMVETTPLLMDSTLIASLSIFLACVIYFLFQL